MNLNTTLFAALCVGALALSACGSEAGQAAATDSGAATTDAGEGGSDGVAADAATGGDAAAGADTASAADAGTADSGGSVEVSFATQVLPILSENCGFCHNDKGQGPAVANKVYYKTKADIFALKGKAYVPGDSAKSGLIGILKQQFGVGQGKTLMPPPKSGRPKVSDADIALVAQWIDEGAKDN